MYAILPSSMIENGTAGTWMTARVKRSVIGSVTPVREKRTETLVPGVPMSESETWASVHPVVGAVSTLHDAIARGTPAFGRRVGEHLGDNDTAADVFDRHADPAVAAARLPRELRIAFGREQLAVRIIELAHETLRGFLVQNTGAEGVDEAVVHQREDLIEDAGAIGTGARLHGEPAREQRDEDQRSDRDGTGPGTTNSWHAAGCQSGRGFAGVSTQPQRAIKGTGPAARAGPGRNSYRARAVRAGSDR